MAKGRKTGGLKPRPPLERFLEHVEITDDCWLWTAGKIWNGYGQFWPARDMVLAHRFSYQTFVGPIPDGLIIDHLCRVRDCVNPDHLEPVTYQENSHRAINTYKTHCIHGHALDEKNTYVDPDGHWNCRACANESNRRYLARKRAQSA